MFVTVIIISLPTAGLQFVILLLMCRDYGSVAPHLGFKEDFVGYTRSLGFILVKMGRYGSMDKVLNA